MKLPTGININMIASEQHSMPSARPPPPAHHLDFDKWSERKFASKWEMANIKIIYDPLVRIPSKRRWTAWSKYNRFSYIFLLTQMYHSTWAFIHFFFFSPLLFLLFVSLFRSGTLTYFRFLCLFPRFDCFSYFFLCYFFFFFLLVVFVCRSTNIHPLCVYLCAVCLRRTLSDNTITSPVR